jgi:hypothetical protein
MAPIQEEVYFPSLEKCLKDQTLLLYVLTMSQIT